MANELNRAIQALADITSMQGRQISDLRESMQQSNQQLSDRIDQMGDRLGSKIDDLAVQVGALTSAVLDQKRSVDGLVEESRSHNEAAKIQAENVANLIKVVDRLAIRN
ncbi:hypothetical protein JOY44_29800 (plasmid) [Phormidium sp. CLA17]|uniref:hypothetical protein n=1 Tax=Leptolyngbya sp. Cla-17 TaxID=2803751 RepID=UPI001492EEE9|nr:hypothetical protein [Leptolyngbya sp. Cla-17]MBM0745616.1 hypothetical protein [Leptolyngbya sp. Cla-17]